MTVVFSTFYFFILTLITHTTFAQTNATIDNVTGVSKFESATSSYKIYGGLAGTCASGDISTTTPCDTCKTSSGGLTPCNRAAIHSTLVMNLTYTSKSALAAATTLTLKMGASAGESTLDTETSVVGGTKTFTFNPTWGQICAILNGAVTGLNADCTIDSGATGDVNSTDYTFRVYEAGTKVAEASLVIHGIGAAYTAPTQDYVSGSYGLRQYEFFPGDQKLVLMEYPVTPNTMPPGSPEFDGVVFYLVVHTSGVTSVDTALYGNARLPQKIFPWNSTSTPPILGDTAYIDEGLNNGQTYCVIAGQRNKAQNIFLFTTANLDANKVCKAPNEVVGILDGAKCFISTAAFGSPMASEVQKLRLFRDRILSKSEFGRAFIEWYYEFSPPVAAQIAKSENLRALTRAALYPLLSVAEITLWIEEKMSFRKESPTTDEK